MRITAIRILSLCCRLALRQLSALVISLIAINVSAQMIGSEENQSVETVPADTIAPHHENIFDKVIGYFSDANKEKKHKKFDFSVIGGPHYSSDTKFGIGIVAAGVYGIDTLRPDLPGSDVSLYGDVTTSGSWLLGIRGNHIAKNDKWRIIYDTRFSSLPSKLWGVGQRACDNDDNESSMKRRQMYVKATWLFRVAPHFYVGPIGRYDYISVDKLERPELLPPGAPRRISNNRFGLNLVFDTRDNLTAPNRGYFLSLSYFSRYVCVPTNDFDFDTADFRFCGYNRLWKGAVLAYEYSMTMNFGDVPWCMMATLGNSYSMRGYYEGRYRDRNKMDTQVELRQHIWRRSGIAIWAGAGIIFDKFRDMRLDDILPNFGIGYRWEFKKNVNVRLDYGIGKRGQSGFIFNINEAF